MADYLITDSFDELIKAVENYKDSLVINKNALKNAANICDQAMGSDDIAKKQIAKLALAFTELERAEMVVQDVLDSLKNDRNKVEDLYQSI